MSDLLSTPPIARTGVTFGAGLGGDATVPPSPPTSSRGQGRPPGPLVLKARSRAVRDLVVDVEVQHLTGHDRPVVTRPGWLPTDPFFGLVERAAEHERLCAEVEKSEAACRAMRQQVHQERGKRAQQLGSEDGAKRPRADGRRLIEESEEAAVAAVVRLLKFCDATMGVIGSSLTEWRDELARRDADAQAGLADARRALLAAQEQLDATTAANAWLSGCSREQVIAWSAATEVAPKPPVDPEHAEMARKIAGWS